MKRLKVSLAIVVALTAGLAGQQKDDDPVITIDGSKNPELIPQWAAWQHAFLVMNGPELHGEPPIPTTVWKTTTPAHRDLIRREAKWVFAVESKLGEDVIKLRDGLTAENLKSRAEEVQSYELKRRKAVLEARDRVVAALPPDAQLALREFVEVNCKVGYKVSMLKSQLEQYRLPE